MSIISGRLLWLHRSQLGRLSLMLILLSFEQYWWSFPSFIQPGNCRYDPKKLGDNPKWESSLKRIGYLEPLRPFNSFCPLVPTQH
ncbi:hypothetical protein QBC32DRAFT_79190 [Pseudoneurospora amorphoporcata]|uniref:Uncharacterized protein n=1 Tax=Pseudoneurospora amorphoporcata TaxID=241081 RepID=A0AAN6NKR4_9PEZI|nr:hypothetical protein QBC32DRAFT_79190 [Pseudoneurospora amorphoporcata]